MHFFSVGAMFKNESHCIIEWIEHYINQGADHFYLVNDNSTDKSVEYIQKYINRITLYNSNEPHILGHQRNTYNKFILPHIKETKWLLMCDLDEFVYSPLYKSIPNFLEQVSYLAQIQITPTLFGSNNHITQPNSLVQGFTKRSETVPTNCGTYKYFVNSDYEYISLNVHHATPKNIEYHKGEYFKIINTPYIKLNHYICQSKEFWIKIKCTRGDADGYLERDMKMFDDYNSQTNIKDDFELAKINENVNIIQY
jgi:glycosyltransferase involved in cell wall biosynthesis